MALAPPAGRSYRPALVQPSPDSPPPAGPTHADPPRSWLAVAALLEKHGFGELTEAADGPFPDVAAPGDDR
jgi:hypothetical protein